MKPDQEKSRERPRTPWRRRAIGVGLVAGLLLTGWLIHGPVLSRLGTSALVWAADRAGYSLSIGQLRVRFGEPVIAGRVGLKSRETWAGPTISSARATRILLSLNPPWKWFGERGKLVQRLAVEGAYFEIDTRGETPQGPPSVMQRPTEAEKTASAQDLLHFLPVRIELSDISGRVIWEGGSLRFSQLSASFDENRLGTLRLASLEVLNDERGFVFEDMRARTAWRDGELHIARLELTAGENTIDIDSLAVGLARPGGLGIDLRAGAFGGIFQGSAFFGEWRGEPGVDAVFWAGGLDMESLTRFAGIDPPVTGTLGESRIAFRGNPDRPIDAEATLRLSVKDLRWGERGWETLQVSASLQNRRMTVGELRLQQSENFLNVNGEVALSGDWTDIRSSPFLFNLSANIRDIGSLAGLLGPPFDETTGRMTLKAVLSGRGSQVEGFAGLEASGIGFRGRAIESVRADARFGAGEFKLDLLEIWSGGDRIAAEGTIGLTAPHAYSASMEADIADLGAYAWIPPDPLPVRSGGLTLRWQGDGHLRANSGAFHATADSLVSDWTPGGLTADIAGTYSPGNIHFGKIRLSHNQLLLALTATLADSGISLGDLRLRRGKTDMADGEVFLPLNAFALAGGTSVEEALVPDLEAYARLATRRGLKISEIFALAGMDAPVDGVVDLNLKLGGLPSDLEAEAALRVRDLRAPDQNFPPAAISLDINASDGTAQICGTAKMGSLQPVDLNATLPFGLIKDNEGRFVWVDPTGSIDAMVVIPEFAISSLQAFVGREPALSGTLSGRLSVSGSAARPVMDGRLRVQGASVDFGSQAPGIADLNIQAALSGSEITFPEFQGTVGGGPFTIAGSISLQNPAEPRFDLRLDGTKLLVIRSPDMRLRSNVALRVSGNASSGSVSGEVGLVGGRIFKRLEITPLIAPLPSERERPFAMPELSGLVPPPFAAWTLDVRIRNETPFLLTGNIASGEIVPDLHLIGTAGEPNIEGTVTISNARAFLPFSTLDIERGIISFRPTDPWMPYLDVRGVSEAMDYEIDLHASGPLRDKNLFLRSDPPLPQESIILLLTTGMAPGTFQGAGLGEAAIGQGGILLLRVLARQLDLPGIDAESFIIRLQVTTSPPQLPGDRTTLSARFRVWENTSLISEQDHLGFYNVGATYRFRFR